MSKKKIIAICIVFCGLVNVVSAQAVRTLTYNKNIKDYSTVIQNMLQEIVNSRQSKGILYIEYGVYPISKTIGVEYQPGTDIRNNYPSKEIQIIGKPNSQGQYPIMNTAANKTPLSVFWFAGFISKPTDFNVKIENLQINGNNMPYTIRHPFFGNKAQPQTAITMVNLNTFSVQNVTVQNFYGNGIVADNYYDNNHDKKYMISNATIRNFKFINSWSENHQNNSSVGIRLGYSKNSLVENCTLQNSLLYSKYPGFIGVDLERRTDKATLRNNTISGFKVAIWTECDYGGHLIEKNHISQTYVGVTFSQDCNQDPKRKYLYSPSTIRNNTFEYGQEYDKINHQQNDWGFISIGKPTFMLDGLNIVGNTFRVKNAKKSSGTTKNINGRVYNNNKLFIDIKNQTKVNMTNNTFE